MRWPWRHIPDPEPELDTSRRRQRALLEEARRQNKAVGEFLERLKRDWETSRAEPSGD